MSTTYTYQGLTPVQLLTNFNQIQDEQDMNNWAHAMEQTIGDHILENPSDKRMNKRMYDTWKLTVDLCRLGTEMHSQGADQKSVREFNSKYRKLEKRKNIIKRVSVKSKRRRMDGFPREDLDTLAGFYKKIFKKKKLDNKKVYLIGIHSGGMEPLAYVANQLNIPTENIELVRWSKSRGDETHLMSDAAKSQFYRKMKDSYVFIFDDTCGSGGSIRNIMNPITYCRPKRVYAGVVNNYGDKGYDVDSRCTKVYKNHDNNGWGKGPVSVWEFSGEIKPGLKTKAKRTLRYHIPKGFKWLGRKIVEKVRGY